MDLLEREIKKDELISGTKMQVKKEVNKIYN